jgi:hypothetical protein
MDNRFNTTHINLNGLDADAQSIVAGCIVSDRGKKALKEEIGLFNTGQQNHIKTSMH